ncbi:putative autophagy-related protein 11 [Halenospora varia]|nr:putative autophagy-related protein 11 [Halenospora varia]
MPLEVLFAHTGKRLDIDPASFTSLDAFKSWVAKNSAVSVQDHIALTPQGKAVKFGMLSTEPQIFIYDRRVSQPTASGSARAFQPEIPLPTKYTPAEFPVTITDKEDLQAWKDLFNARRTWALKVVEDCAAMSDEAQERYSEIQVIAHGVDAAVYNLEKHAKAVDQKNADVQAWSRDFLKDQEMVGSDSEASIQRLRSIPTTSEVVRFIAGRDPRRNSRQSTLEDLVDVEEMKKAGQIVRHISTQLSRNSANLGTKVDSILQKIDELFEKVEKHPARKAFGRAAESVQLMEDIEPIAKKVSSDYESVLGYTGKNSISQASRSALLHTKNYLPSLVKRATEMDGILRFATEARNTIAVNSLDRMREIATLTAFIGETTSQFAALELNDDGLDAFNLLQVLNALPVTYASFLAEAIKRKDWNEKVRSDTSTLANEMATFQDEEARRRRKWQKSTGQQLDELLEILRSQDAKSELVTEVTKIISDLNNPTKQQNKRAKAFKAGSIHEAALGRSALLVRGDDDLIRQLQEDKQKLENKDKTSQSRIRRLEDLLHRQSQLSNRNSTGNVFQLPGNPSPDQQINGNPLASPRLHDDSRRSSVSSRRFSANQGAEEKAIQQKILSLEAELIAERERASGLEKEISMRKSTANDMQAKVEEANSTKQDLMENFDAQQREFIEERKALETEIKRLKQKHEELEDEMDRYLGSRENEKASVDERVRILQDELEKVNKEHTAEAQKAQGQVDFLRNDAKLQRETNDTLEKQLQKLREENKLLLTRTENAESAAEIGRGALLDVHECLRSSGAPDELPALAEAVRSLCGDMAAELESIKSDATIARSDRDAAQTAVTTLKTEVETTKNKLAEEESQTSQLRETLEAQKAKFTALEEELTDERGQLTALRKKIADGETGSEALRNRLEEEEKKVTSMAEELATRQSRIGGIEEELRSFHEKHEFAQNKHDKLVARFEARSLRAKDLTQRAYAQNDRLCRLLERLSYSVTREGGTMTIQRIPRPDRTNANDSSDPGTSLRKSISGSVTRKAMVDSGDLDLLYWMNNDDSGAESEKYEAYLNAIGSFDVEAFCDVISKRIRDIEYTAKKYARDARAYREKSHAAQKEAHEKIAYKHFKEGDLALFLPTRNQATQPWAAFNVGAPHYFLREQDSHKLRTRDWLLARIHKIEDRVVDLSKSMTGSHIPDGSFGAASNGGDSFEDDNPFELSDEKPGAPSTPGLGKSTVASAHIDATGSIRRSKKSSSGGVEGINRTLSKSLDSRRSSANPLIKPGSIATDAASLKAASTTSLQQAGEASDSIATRHRSNQDGTGSEDKALTSEVRNYTIDDLLSSP